MHIISTSAVRGMRGPEVQWSRPSCMSRSFEAFVQIISTDAVRGMSGPVVQWSRPTCMSPFELS